MRLWGFVSIVALVLAGLVAWPARTPQRLASPPSPPNPVAWIPAQCWAKTSATSSGCHVCHQTPRLPNFIEDAPQQTQLSFARAASQNPWRNLFSPPPAAELADSAVLAWVREQNYSAGRDADCWFRFDAEGFDRTPSGALSGWRAFTYLPLPGMFLPTNGSDGDAMIRLPAAFREADDGKQSADVYRLNLALLEAFIRREDVPIKATDERPLGVDLDGDGQLATATSIAFEWPLRPERPLHYVGRAAQLDPAVDGRLVAGLFPRETEFLHTVRYFDVDANGVGPSVRLKELRRMRKVRWLNYAQLEENALAEGREKTKSPNSLRHPQLGGGGAHSGTGWVLQGLIEDERGALRPQTSEEITSCIGCHGGVGATSDSTFSFARKLPGEAGWRYATKTQLHDIQEPRRADGEGEYAHWLRQLGAADDFHANTEAALRFFDAGKPRPEAFAALARDVSLLLVPGPTRALDLNRAYLGLVRAQAFEAGRDVMLVAPKVHRHVEQDQPTGVAEPFVPGWVRHSVTVAGSTPVSTEPRTGSADRR